MDIAEIIIFAIILSMTLLSAYLVDGRKDKPLTHVKIKDAK